MPTLFDADPVQAIVTADWHLCDRPPAARKSEPDWFDAMRRPLNEIRWLQTHLKRPAVLVAGDIFDTWRVSPALLSFALRHIPENTYVIPGQHDLPYHRYEDVYLSALWTLVEAKRVCLIPNTGPVHINDRLSVFGFPWKAFELREQQKARKKLTTTSKQVTPISLALVHAYCFVNGAGYPNAPQEARAGNLLKEFTGFDWLVVGDNHVPFESSRGATQLFNCGSLMRRRSDQQQHRPRVGLLHRSGAMSSYELDCSLDALDVSSKEEPSMEDLLHSVDLELVLRTIRSLSGGDLDWREAVRLHLQTNDVPDGARRAIQLAMEGVREGHS